MSSQKIALITLLIASLFWATSGIAAKILLRTMDPLSVGAVRLTFAAIVILPFFLRVTPKITKQLFLDMLPTSLLVAVNFLFFLFGIDKTTANAGAIMYTATPIMAAIFSRALIGEHISKQKIMGILLGLAGVLTILLLPIFENGRVIVGDVGGNLLILGAMIVFSLYNVSTRHLTTTKHYHPVTIIGISLFTSALVFNALLFFIPHSPILPALFVPFNFWLILYFAAFVTVLPYILHQWAIKHSSATTGSLTTYIQPVFGFIFNGILLGEVITEKFLVGSLLVFAGTFMATGAQMVRMMRSKF
jgi:drug/metabolite transporter (DMT)-like permease